VNQVDQASTSHSKLSTLTSKQLICTNVMLTAKLRSTLRKH
jgi:hypothetical protein